MSVDPIAFFRETFPELFHRGVEQVRRAAESGDERAQTRLDDTLGARGSARVVIEGEGELWLKVHDGTVTAADAMPDDPPVRVAVAVPAAAAREVLSEAEGTGVLADDEAAFRAARSASKRVQDELEGRTLEFHVIVAGVPEQDDVVVRVGLGVPEPPQEPRFTATVRYDDLERLREGELDGQQLFMGGRVRFTGDYAPALQLAMQLVQKKR